MIQVIYQDEHLIAVNKPSGLLSVPGLSSDENLLADVLKEFPNGRTVHRLDMSTSGLVLFALSYPAQKTLNSQFATRQIHKHYTAVVEGIVSADSGEINLPLICDWPNRPRQKVDWLCGKPALTNFQTLERRPALNQTLVALYPITGRSHQLRVHCLGINHPILGDQLYNQRDSHLAAPRLLLHATGISLSHPITREPLSITCPPDF